MSFNYSGFISKSRIETEKGVHYFLRLDNHSYAMNSFLGKQLEFSFLGEIQCVNCQRPIKKTYHQGYCYPCFVSLASCDLCIMKPELCHYHKGTCREPEWGLAHCMQPHVVYLANTSQVKVGITRLTQVPTRWLDQGAVQAIPVFQVSQRYHAGLIEIELAKHFSDKTNWRNLLKAAPEKLDLKAIANSLQAEYLEGKLVFSPCIPKNTIQVLDDMVANFEYPIIKYPEKIKSFNLDKTPSFKAQLIGMKGQYLLFDSGVINLRKYTGYKVQLKVE